MVEVIEEGSHVAVATTRWALARALLRLIVVPIAVGWSVWRYSGSYLWGSVVGIVPILIAVARGSTKRDLPVVVDLFPAGREGREW